MLCEHLAGCGILDDERSRRDRRRSCRVCRGGEGERRENCGGPDPEDHERQG
jgi:hypothetical protein